MKDQFVPYELALKLKELGFNEKCFGYYADKKIYIHNSKSKNYINLEAPLWQQAFDWFRENYDINSYIDRVYKNGYYDYEYFIEGETIFGGIKTHEEARKACLEKLIELCKNQ